MAKKNVLTAGKKLKAEQAAHAGNLDQAHTLFASICKLDPTDADAWAKLGALRFRLGRYDEAESCARRALLLSPKLTFAQQTLATVLQHKGKPDEASSILQNALAQSPQSPESLIDLARLREKQGLVQEAFELYHQALNLRPDSPYVLAKRGELFEKEGRLVEAEECIARGLAQMPNSPILNLSAARLDRRMGRHAEAAARLEAVIDQPLTQDLGMEIHLLLGQIYDRLGNTNKALPHSIEGKHRMALRSDPDGSSRARFLAKCGTARSWLTDRLVASSRAAPQPYEAPVFLIGFPRSGTTLLEQILDSHPRLQTLDEKPMVEVLKRAFLEMAGNRTDALADLTDDQIFELRKIYWEEAARHVIRRPGTMLVDKLPLNIVDVPLLWRIFPEARFILAIRHPCDVTLSCLMQNFGVNDAMVGFISLEGVATIYAHVMDAWCEYAKRIPLHWQRIRYEDLITNFEPEARALLDFLGVGWSDTVLEHTRHAQQRGIINTPSYHQVVQPIYQHSKFRWTRYEHQLADVMPILQPFIERFGYA